MIKEGNLIITFFELYKDILQREEQSLFTSAEILQTFFVPCNAL